MFAGILEVDSWAAGAGESEIGTAWT